MMKKLLSLFTVLLLASALAVGAFAASSALVLDGSADTDYDALVKDDTFIVYVVLSPLSQGTSTKAGTNMYYRPAGSAKTGAQHNMDITSQTFAINWSAYKDFITLASYEFATDASGDGVVDFTSFGSGAADLYWAQAVYGSTTSSRTSVEMPFAPAADATGIKDGVVSVTFTRDGSSSFAAYKVAGTAATKAVVAKLTFKVTADDVEDKDIVLTLNDSYIISGTAKPTETSTLTVTVAAATGCRHTVAEDRVTGKVSEVIATCTEAGSVTFVCSECSETITESTGYADHNYIKDGNDNVIVMLDPTCTTEGYSVIKCTACGLEKEESRVTLPATGHAFANGDVAWAAIVLSEKSCISDGKVAYYCQVCHALAAHKTAGVVPAKDATAYADWYYNNGHYYRDAALTSERFGVTAPDACVSVTPAEGHTIVKVSGKYTCTNSATCDPFTRYVGAASKGNGETNATYTDYITAIDYFSNIGSILTGTGIEPKDLDCKIIIVENQKVNFGPRVVSANNTVSNSFEEKPHAAHITVTSENPNNKSGIHFVEGCSSYFLYGDMTFENITITADFTTGVYIAARNFKLVMGEGIECVGIDGGTIEVSNNETAVSSALNLALEIPDVKVYLIGGILVNSIGDILVNGGRDDLDHNNDLNTYLEIHSGQYWAVYHYNRSDKNGVTNGKGIVNFVGDVEVAHLNVNTESGDINNSYALTIYNGPVKIVTDWRYKQSNVNGSGNTYDRVFLDGAADMKVGRNDFGGVKNVVVAMNFYYSPNMESNAYVKAYIKKYANGTSAGFYNFDGESGLAGKWCVDNSASIFGTNQHVYVSNGKCSLCGTTFCKNNRHGELIEEVILEPTCSENGYSNIYCGTCYTYTTKNKELAPIEEAHNLIWVSGIRKCEHCGTITSSESLPAEFDAIYVSSKNATKDGGFAPETPTDFDAAIHYAASASGDVTIYILDRAVVPSANFVEPFHRNTITICGYATKGVFEIGGGETVTSDMYYIMNGPVVFENVEFSTGNSYVGKAYLEARHNKLVIGENVSADIKNHNGTESSRICVLGGCYKNSECGSATGDSDVTIYSGVYNSIFAGSVAGNCNTTGTLNIKFYGDVSAKEFVHFGSYSLDANVSNVELRGTLSCNSYINFGSYGKTSKNVNIYLFGGTMISQANAKNIITLGASAVDKTNTALISQKLTVYYDPTNASTVTLASRIKDGADTAKLQLKTMDADSYCEVNKGAHTAGATVETVAATCYSEGYVLSKCTACSVESYRSATTEMLEHIEVVTGTIDATCASAGLLRYSCDRDGCNAVVFKVNPDASTPLDGTLLEAHNFDEKTGVCVDCNANKTVVCGNRLSGHSYVETAVTASCGVGRAYECTSCGYTRVDLESENHNYGAYSITVQPTETTPGVKSRTCKGCGKVDTALVYATDSVATEAVATTTSGSIADLDIATSKLSKTEKAALNALIQDEAYGSEIKVSYKVEGNAVTDITYSIPVPAEYADMTNVKILVKDDNGRIHVVDFKIEKGYFVFNF